MIDKLILLSGDSSLSQIDPRDLDDESAGLWLLFQIARAAPGITWGQLLAADSQNLAGFFSSLSRVGKWIGTGTRDFVTRSGTVLKDTLSVTGDFLGSGVRLATDRQVIDGAGQIAAAVGTGGLSLAVPSGLQEIFGNVDGAGISDFLAQLGIGAKRIAGAPSPAGSAAPSRMPLYLAGGAAALVALMLVTRRN